jgi:hypothetical protein
MKKLLALITLVILGLKSFAGVPDEGMWLPMFVERLNYVDMQKMGLRLTAQEIYNINNSSLKDAIVGLGEGSAPDGYFCSGEIVSDKGLMFTNHHCGYDAVQKLSSVNSDYLANGFWAMKMEEELPCEGLEVSFLVRMDDVTAKVLGGLSDTLSDKDRSAKIKEITTALSKEASESDKYQAVVKSFFAGNEYYLFVYQTYRDVRLAGVPPSSIGKFGGDTDNWMWPRHTGDFCVFRIYAGTDGNPADYSKENVPFKPKHHLPVSLKGVQKNDFAMIMGYPGTTQRYMTSYGVNMTLETLNPLLIKLLGKKLEIWKEDMDADKATQIKYASKYASYANSWKNFIGESRGLKRLKVYDKKLELENDFQKWANADPAREKKYGNALKEIGTAIGERKKMMNQALYLSLGAFGGAEIIGYSQQFTGLHSALEKSAGKESLENFTKDLREGVKAFYKDFNAATDQKILAAMFEICRKEMPADQQPDIFAKIEKKYKGDVNKWAADVFAKSMFASEDKVNKFLDKPSFKALDKDPVFQIMNSVYPFMMNIQMSAGSFRRAQAKGERLFLAGLREMQPDKKFYPDANSTMRFTYGSVLDYVPADAVEYNFYTNLSGIIEKEDPTNEEFIVPAKLKELYEKKDFGQYGSGDDLRVCFITTNDITGGNSGSGVMNGNGELIGIAFDGNWEAMSGNIAFESDLQRTICVDIRYVLFVIDKFAGAKNLINELTLRR